MWSDQPEENPRCRGNRARFPEVTSPTLLPGSGASRRCDLPASASGKAWAEGKTSGPAMVSPKQSSPVRGAVPAPACKATPWSLALSTLDLNLRNAHPPATRARPGRNGQPAPFWKLPRAERRPSRGSGPPRRPRPLGAQQDAMAPRLRCKGLLPLGGGAVSSSIGSQGSVIGKRD